MKFYSGYKVISGLCLDTKRVKMAEKTQKKGKELC